MTAEQQATLSALGESWQQAIKQAGKWPFVDPDEAMSKPDPSFGDYPDNPDEIPSDIVPFSEFEPWGKMEEETGRDYQLFSYYRALGLTRTYAETGRHFNISGVYVGRIAGRHDWDERVRQWDLYREQVYTTEVLEGVKQMARDHAKIASKGIEALSAVFDILADRLKDDPEELERLKTMPTKTLFLLADKAAKSVPGLMNAERLSRGMPTEISSTTMIKENRVVVQTSDELAEIVFGLQSVLEKKAEAEALEAGDEVIDVEGEEVEEGDPGAENSGVRISRVKETI